MTPKITNDAGIGVSGSGAAWSIDARRGFVHARSMERACFFGRARALWPPKPARIADRIFSRKGVLLARAEARKERRRQHFGRHRLLDRGLDGPAAFAGILDEAGVAIERRILPRAPTALRSSSQDGDHAAAPPHLGDVGEIEVEAMRLRQRLDIGVLRRMSKPSAIGLHHPVFDAVVDHLDEMPGADRAGMDIAVLDARIARPRGPSVRGMSPMPGASVLTRSDRAARPTAFSPPIIMQ